MNKRDLQMEIEDLRREALEAGMAADHYEAESRRLTRQADELQRDLEGEEE